MPLPLLALLIPSLATVATSLITYGMNKTEIEKAKEQDKYITGLARKDELAAQEKTNILNTKQSDLTDEKISFNKSISEKNIKLQSQDDLYQQKKTGVDQLNSAVQGMKPSDDSWLYKSKVLSRF